MSPTSKSGRSKSERATSQRATSRRAESDPAVVHPLERAVSALVEDAREVRAAATVFEARAEHAEQRYADEVATSLASLELDLSIARAALDAQLADDAEELNRSMQVAADAGRTWLDELKIQSRLARMEARDRAGVLAEHIDHSSAAVRRAGSRVIEAVSGDVEELRQITLDGIGDVRRALSDTAAALRGLGD